MAVAAPVRFPGDPDPDDEFDDEFDEFDIPDDVLVAACDQASSPDKKRGTPPESAQGQDDLAKRQKSGKPALIGYQSQLTGVLLTDTCFKCGRTGHWASNCPNQGAGSPAKPAPTQDAPAKQCPCERALRVYPQMIECVIRWGWAV